MNQYEEIELVCEDCSNPFVWSAGEQMFVNDLLEKGKLDKIDINTGDSIPGKVNTPKRCRECRAKKRADRQSRGLPK